MGSPPACDFAQGHPSPAKQCVFTTSSASTRRRAMVVLSRIETTIAESKMMNLTMVFAMGQKLWLRLCPHTWGIILWGSFVCLLRGFVRYPIDDCACGTAFRVVASSLLGLFVQRVHQIVIHLHGSGSLLHNFYDNLLLRHTFQLWSCGPNV